MIKYQISSHLQILFVGINPHPGSYRRGVPFSNNKSFWYLLSDAGLIHESRQELKDDKNLKKMYEKKLIKKYKLGFINLIARPTNTIAQLKKDEALQGRKKVLHIIHYNKPNIVCFIGKTTYKLFAQLKECVYGWQPSIEYSQIYVMHTPLHGAAGIRINELKELKKATTIFNAQKKYI